MTEFTFELCASCVLALDRAVQRQSGDRKRETLAFEAGRQIAKGSRRPEHLKAIAHWKAPRASHHIESEKNTPGLISEVLEVAVGDQTLAQKVDQLVRLTGVEVAMASAILTCIDPSQYTVIDVRALDALGVQEKPNTDLYERYLAFCRATAKELGVELRQLDRALWKAGSIT